MIDELADNIYAIGSWDCEDNYGHDKIKYINVEDHDKSIYKKSTNKILSKLLYKLGVKNKMIKRFDYSKQIINAINDDSVSIIFIHFLNYALLFENILYTTNKPVFVHCHGWDVTWDMRYYDNPNKKMHDNRYISDTLEFSKRVTFIANSNTTKQKLVDIGVDENKIIVKYLGVPVHECYKHNDINEFNIIYIGRFIDFKGPDIVIKAYNIAMDQGLNANLIMAGDGPLYKECLRLKSESKFKDRITLLGAIDGKKGEELRSEASIFTAHNCYGKNTHQEEAYGVSLVEAMGCGIPVITGKSGSTSEIIDNGINGILVEPGDVIGHANAFLKLRYNSELRTSIGYNAWLKAKNKYSIEQEKNKLMNIFYKVNIK